MCSNCKFDETVSPFSYVTDYELKYFSSLLRSPVCIWFYYIYKVKSTFVREVSPPKQSNDACFSPEKEDEVDEVISSRRSHPMPRPKIIFRSCQFSFISLSFFCQATNDVYNPNRLSMQPDNAILLRSFFLTWIHLVKAIVAPICQYSTHPISNHENVYIEYN